MAGKAQLSEENDQLINTLLHEGQSVHNQANTLDNVRVMCCFRSGLILCF